MTREQSAQALDTLAVEPSRDQHVTPRAFKVGDPLPVALDAHDIAHVFGRSVKTVHGWHKAGKLRRFDLPKPIGSKRWSGRKLQEFLDGGGALSVMRRSA
jgi:hypothetical protein